MAGRALGLVHATADGGGKRSSDLFPALYLAITERIGQPETGLLLYELLMLNRAFTSYLLSRAEDLDALVSVNVGVPVSQSRGYALVSVNVWVCL